jgi:predicted transcriptional regulator
MEELGSRLPGFTISYGTQRGGWPLGEAQQDILAVLHASDEPMQISQIAKAVDRQNGNVHTALAALCKRGLVEPVVVTGQHRKWKVASANGS